jgi:hypothetical protein
VSQLAQGGMAELFLARLPGIEGFAKKVVIKRVLPALARDRDFIEMFLEEARLAATLQHQNIVAVHDIDHDEDGYFFAMEYLHGADVGELMRSVGGELPLHIALEIARGACAGLHYAHERKSSSGALLGLVHRDVSPQNIFATFEGGVKLLDFGIAKAVQQTPSHYTRSGTLRGKLPYMSPEQCRGVPIDRRSDVFSLAIVIWEMTVGERLYGARGESDFDVLKSIVETDAPRPSTRKPGYPPALEAIAMKGLQRDRERRYQTCDELLGDLEAFMRAQGQWVTPRDLAQYMIRQFGERAASSMKLAAQGGGDIVPFPRATRVVGPPSEGTIDLPRQNHRMTPPPAAPAQAAQSAPTPAPRRSGNVGLVIACIIAVAAVAVAVGFYLGRGPGSGPPGEVSSTSRAAPPPAATTPAAANPAAPAASQPTRPAPATDLRTEPAAPIVRTGGLALNAEVSGVLAPHEVRRYPFTIANGRYHAELFVKAPDPLEPSCSRPSVTLTIVDRDDARVGDVVVSATWDRDNWEKHHASYDLSGQYGATVRADNCRVHYRVRVVPAAP